MYRLKPGERLRTYRPEARDDWQLIYVAAGVLEATAADGLELVRAGELISYAPGEPQAYVYYGDTRPEVWWVHFSGTEAEALVRRMGMRGSRDRGHGQVSRTDAASAEGMRERFLDMICELQLRRPGFREACAIRLADLALAVSRARLEQRSGGAGGTEGAVREAALHMNARYAEPFDVADWARSHGVSTSWFIRRFRELMGETPKRYLTMCRLRRAQVLLASGDKNVSEAARDVGYRDPLYFGRLYREYMGETPSHVRLASRRG